MPATTLRSLAIALALTFTAPLPARSGATEDAKPVLVRGDAYAFLVDTPPGWQHDCETLADDGICALFYRPGESFTTAPVVLYVNPREPDSLGLEHAIARDVADLREKAPAVVMRDEPPLYARFQRPVLVRRFEHAGGAGTTELAGYLAEKTCTILFVASAKTPDDLERAHAAFARLVQSYDWITDRVSTVR